VFMVPRWGCSSPRRWDSSAHGTCSGSRFVNVPARRHLRAVDRVMRVLLSAYACTPGSGSEPYMGHNWVKQISRFHDVVVLTDARNRQAIERYPYGDRVRFEFVQAPVGDFATSRHFRDWRGGEWWAYYCFTLKSFARARRLLREEAFDLSHLVTWANF